MLYRQQQPFAIDGLSAGAIIGTNEKVREELEHG